MLEIRFLTLKLLVLTFVCQSAVFVTADDPQKILAVLNKHCSDCHQKVNPEAGLSLDKLSLDFADGKRVDDVQLDMWQRVHEQITLGAMPPAESAQLSVSEAGQVKEWISHQLRAVGKKPAVWHKLNSPQFGTVSYTHLTLPTKRIV